MKKLNLIITHPIFVLISFITFYIIGVSNKFLLGLKDIRIHFIYLSLITFSLGFIGAQSFMKEFFKDKYSNFKKVFNDEKESSEGIYYVNKILYFLEKKYSDYILNYIFIVYVLVCIVLFFNGIYLDSDISNYIFLCFYLSICLSLFFLNTFDYVIKSEIKEDIGVDFFNDYISNHSAYEFNNYKVSTVIFSVASILIIIFFILKHYQLF